MFQNQISFSLVLFFIIAISCKENRKNSESNIPVLPTKENLQGVWKMDKSIQDDFRIEGDSIYFTEPPQPAFRYEIKNDSFKIFFPEFEFAYKAEVFGKDSVRFLTEQMMMTYRRVR